MTTAAPPTLTDPPTAMDPSDRSTFNARAYAWATFQGSTFIPQLRTALANVYANAVDAYASAVSAAASAATATAQATTAVSAVGATVWVSGTYSQYAVAISPTDGLTYRKTGVTGVSSTDPKFDTVNWVCLNSSSSAASSIFLQQNFGGI